MKKALLLTLKWGGVLTVGVIIGISIKLVTAWVESDQLPPGGNIAAPLNTGSAGQSKKGGLTLNIGGAQYGLIVANGLVGIGTTNPNEKLTVEGNLSLKEGDSSPATTSGYTKIYSKKVDASYTKLLLHADGNNGSTVFGDSSLSAHGVTAYGNAKISTAQSKFGGSSAYFDGSGDYLGVGDSNDWDVGSIDFTLDFWVRPSNVGSDKTLFAKRGSSASINYFTVYISSGSYKFAATSNGSSWDIASGTSMGSANANAWAHLAVARSGSSILLFQNGSLINTINTSSAILDKDNSSLVIGADTDTGSLDGYIDEFRFSKGVARWTSSFTPPSAAYNAVDSNAAMLYYKNSEGVEYQLPGGSNETTNTNTNTTTGTGDGVPQGTISFFDLATCPTGWTEVPELRGRYVVGLPSGGTLGVSSATGTALSDKENRATGAHNHPITDPGHSHMLPFGNGGAGPAYFYSYVYANYTYQNSYNNHPVAPTASTTTNISVNAPNAPNNIAGTNAPYIQYLACKKTSPAGSSGGSGSFDGNFNGNLNVNGNVSANAFCLGGVCKNSWDSSGGGILADAQWEWTCKVSQYTFDTVCSYDIFTTDPRGTKQYINNSCNCYCESGGFMCFSLPPKTDRWFSAFFTDTDYSCSRGCVVIYDVINEPQPPNDGGA